MENGRDHEPFEVEENSVRKVITKLNQRAPRRALEQLDKFGRGLGKVNQIPGQRLDDHAVLDRITFESERVIGSHSEASSRRNSDDGGRAKKEVIRDGMTLQLCRNMCYNIIPNNI